MNVYIQCQHMSNRIKTVKVSEDLSIYLMCWCIPFFSAAAAAKPDAE